MKSVVVSTIVAAALLAGCGAGSSNPVAMQSVAPVEFMALAKQVLMAPADSSAPMELGNMKIAFGDDENPQAFDDVLPPAS